MHPLLVGFEQQFNPSPLTAVHDPLLERHRIELLIKRDDLLHPVISGNKWRKLKYILDHALMASARGIISMGGAYSNHLHALAYAGKTLGFETAAYIRGEKPDKLNATLIDLQHWGMQLDFVPRSKYRQLRRYKTCHALPGLQPGQYWLPEGGSLPLALTGVREIVREIDVAYDVLCVPCGTGTTMAGIISAVSGQRSIIGFAALKGADFLQRDIALLLQNENPHLQRQTNATEVPHGAYPRWTINQQYHFGGFAKTNADLFSFIERFEDNNGITLEPIYTGKMLYGIFDLIKQNYFAPGQRIVALHTGGLQGNRGFERCKDD